MYGYNDDISACIQQKILVGVCALRKRMLYGLQGSDVSSGGRERSGSVVECLTRDPGVAGLSLTGVTALWSLSKTHLS